MCTANVCVLTTDVSNTGHLRTSIHIAALTAVVNIGVLQVFYLLEDWQMDA